MVGAHDRRGLGEAIAFEHRPAHVDEPPEDLRRERGGAAHEHAQAVEPRSLPDRADERAPDPKPRTLAHEPGETQQQPRPRARRPGGVVDAPVDRGHELFIEERHADEQRRPRCGHVFAQLARGEPSRRAHGGAHAQRAQESTRALERVMERQDAQEPIGGSELERPRHRLDVEEQVRVAQHHALGLPGRARREQQRRQVPRLGERRRRRRAGELAQCQIPCRERAVGVEREQAQRRPARGAGGGERRQVARVADRVRGLGGCEQLAQLLLPQLSVERHDDGPCGEDRQEGKPPLGAVVALQAHACPRPHALALEQRCERAHGARGRRERVARPRARDVAQQEQPVAVALGRVLDQLGDQPDDRCGRGQGPGHGEG